MLRKTILTTLFVLAFFVSNGTSDGHLAENNPGKISKDIRENIGTTEELYRSLQLESVISYDALEKAVIGYISIGERAHDILTLIDFSKPSNTKRLAVIDMKHGRVLETSVVSHGQGSGALYATKFSNRDGSHQSSLGFYLTGGTYSGGNGYSLKLIGLEKGYNDKALDRAIVVHGADYCSESVIGTAQRLGRSWGCPALPRAKSRKIIDTIKGGSVLFIYAEDGDYLAHSPILSRATGGFMPLS